MIITDDLPAVVGAVDTPAPSWRASTDVIIVGSGAAGLSAALPLLQAGRRVTLITKGHPGDGSTAWAQGGLAAVLDPADDLASHLEDTLTAGAGLCEPDQVRRLVGTAPATIERLRRLGARWDTGNHGYALGLEGGHRHRRIVHAGGDASGAEVARTLAAAVHDHPLLTVREHSTVADLITTDGRVTGVRLIDDHHVVGELSASAVVLATGGVGQAWDTTTNPPTATGDGLALALRAGAVLRDVEFVQFHPTVLVVPESHRRPGDRGVLISEAVRGEGARLIDRRGALIMQGRHPLADLAPRDVVSATMHAHLMATGDDHLFLDGTGLGGDVWREHFPTILQLCRDRGVDPITEPIPVRPAEHYSCGGVLATLDGRTTVPGLYAVGEVASTGVQGANRLASNSLPEALIAGDLCGARLSSVVGSDSVEDLHLVDGAHLGDICGGTYHRPTPTAGHVPAAARGGIVAAVSRGAGVLREETGLAVLLKTLGDIDVADGAATAADVEATNLHTVATVVAAAALARTESRGCHRRSDHTGTDPRWRRHSLIRLTADDLVINASEELG